MVIKFCEMDPGSTNQKNKNDQAYCFFINTMQMHYLIYKFKKPKPLKQYNRKKV